ncbi:MAG: c-type cytochrome [Kofleriaceae bacterium]
MGSPLEQLAAAPADALVLDARLDRWDCTFTDPGGGESRELKIPVGRAVHLRIKNDDNVDGDLSFEAGISVHVASHGIADLVIRANEAGDYPWRCPVEARAEYPDHTNKTLVALPPGQYATHAKQLQASTNPQTPAGKAALGRRIFENKGCVSCHTLDGSARIGMTLAGIWGRPVTLQDGTIRTVDATFVRDSLIDPVNHVRKGFPASMPSYQGQLREKEIDAFIALIESLK